MKVPQVTRITKDIEKVITEGHRPVNDPELFDSVWGLLFSFRHWLFIIIMGIILLLALLKRTTG